MISLEELDKTILDLEQRDTTYAVCEKLSWLYTVRDHLVPQRKNTSVSTMTGSEFIETASGCDICAILKILDEHLECLKLVYPREYDALIRKIKEL